MQNMKQKFPDHSKQHQKKLISDEKMYFFNASLNFWSRFSHLKFVTHKFVYILRRNNKRKEKKLLN